ncbi:hypothetical protein SLA2020_233440 [Shorea laevis]
MGCIPFDIVVDIFVRLPVKSVMRFKSLSKQCDGLVHDSKFIRSHLQNTKSKGEHHHFILQRYERDPEFLVLTLPKNFDCGDVVHAAETSLAPRRSVDCFQLIKWTAECDGMLCIPHGPSLVIWNPSTKKHWTILTPPRPDFTDSVGLGYDSTLDDYKVVNIMGPPQHIPTTIQCLRLRTGTWNTAVNDVKYEGFKVAPEAGKSVNGSIYWIARVWDSDQFPTIFFMVRFDLETETLKEEKLPSDILNERRCVLGLVGGSVSVTVRMRRHYVVWVKEENTETKSWKKLFRFRASASACNYFYFSPYITNNGQVLTNEYGTRTRYELEIEEAGELFLYNLKDKSVKNITVKGLSHPSDFAMISYVESLVSPSPGA